MMILSLVVGVSALGSLFALICRLNMLNRRDNQPASIGMHIGLAFSVLWALNEAIHQDITPGSIGAVIASVCWLVVSFPTWVKRTTGPCQKKPIRTHHGIRIR